MEGRNLKRFPKYLDSIHIHEVSTLGKEDKGHGGGGGWMCLLFANCNWFLGGRKENVIVCQIE